jgi:hypothetical protein
MIRSICIEVVIYEIRDCNRVGQMEASWRIELRHLARMEIGGSGASDQ